MDYKERLITSMELEGDNDTESVIRPRSMDEYIGQKKLKENLSIFIEAAKKKGRGFGSYFALRSARAW